MKIEDRATPAHSRFVLLQHTLPPLATNRPSHWDLMIDLGEMLLTFELRELPKTLPLNSTPIPLPASRLADHRRAYLEYEGPLTPDPHSRVPRGSVVRVAAGWVETEHPGDSSTPRYVLTAPELRAQLHWPACAISQAICITVYQWEWSSPSP